MKKCIVSVLLILFILCGCTAQKSPEDVTTAPADTTHPETTSEPSPVEETSTSEHSTVNKPTAQITNRTDIETSTKAPDTTVAITTPTTQPDTSAITVTVYCSCKNAVDYGIRDKKDYSDLIPADGIMLSSSVTVKKGCTALDAIKEACLQSNTEIDEKRGYIRGIGGLYEKDCGGASGWMYSVNGTFPNMSSDKYTLESSDRIELHYTVKLGDVN